MVFISCLYVTLEQNILQVITRVYIIFTQTPLQCERATILLVHSIVILIIIHPTKFTFALRTQEEEDGQEEEEHMEDQVYIVEGDVNAQREEGKDDVDIDFMEEEHRQEDEVEKEEEEV